MARKLTQEALIALARSFCQAQSKAPHPELFGVTDGKAVGTYVEHLFQALILERYDIAGGNSAKGIDLPAVNADIKVTSVRQPQSSCPFKSAREKVYGLDYNLLLFVYDKRDDAKRKAAMLNFVCCAHIEQSRTADYQTTYGLLGILERNGNRDDVFGFLEDRRRPCCLERTRGRNHEEATDSGLSHGLKRFAMAAAIRADRRARIIRSRNREDTLSHA